MVPDEEPFEDAPSMQKEDSRDASLEQRQGLMLWFLTFAGVALQIIPALPTISGVAVQLSTSGVIPFTNDIALIAWYATGPMFFCIFFSFTLGRKRIVSPLIIQIGTVSLATVLIADSALRESIPLTSPYIANFGISFVLSLLLLIVLGIVQTRAVTWTVGKYVDEDLPAASYALNLDFENAISTINDNFLYVRSLARKTSEDGFRLFVYKDDRDENVLIGIGRDASYTPNSIVAVVAFESGPLDLSSSEGSARIADSIVDELERVLAKKHPEVTLKEINTSNSILEKTMGYALRQTHSVLEGVLGGLRKAHAFYSYATGLMVIALVALTVAVAYGKIDFGTYVSTAVVVLIALFVELGLALREEIKGSKTESAGFREIG